MKDNRTHALAWGIAFVGFTTQFGGGFASGAQIYQYFIHYGIWGIVMPALAQFLLSLFYWYGMRYAFRHQTYDYRCFSDHFYGKFRPLFSNLYEIEYLVMICLAPAVAFATGGATLHQLTGLPYLLCTAIIGVFIFVVTLFGTELVRKCSSVLSVLIIAGLLLVLVPNLIAQWDTIVDALHRMAAGALPTGSQQDGSFGSALWSACVYGIFQITAIGLMYQHTSKLEDERDVGRSMIYMFFVDLFVMQLTVFGLLAIAFHPDLTSYDVPMLLLVQTGVGATLLTPVISVLIILGAVSTGVNMIAGIVTRTVNQLERRQQRVTLSRHRLYSMCAALAFTLLAFAVAQFGLIPLVSRGYSYIGYATLFVIVLPFVLHAIAGLRKKGDSAK
ncbi:MAG TPA: hypothetical protein IAA32_01150 [Candidatus Butyricicoccus stercorigallinarum]|nr:hypothetical protein [Candidatus Butyricicoccus stercorigallinarum]